MPLVNVVQRRNSYCSCYLPYSLCNTQTSAWELPTRDANTEHSYQRYSVDRTQSGLLDNLAVAHVERRCSRSRSAKRRLCIPLFSRTQPIHACTRPCAICLLAGMDASQPSRWLSRTRAAERSGRAAPQPELMPEPEPEPMPESEPEAQECYLPAHQGRRACSRSVTTHISSSRSGLASSPARPPKSTALFFEMAVALPQPRAAGS